MKRAGLAATIKARWICEQAHQQLKEKLGLDHFEGRSWQGLHRHALMTMIAYAFLQHRHLTQVGRKKESTDRRLSLACRPYATPSSISFFDHYLSNAHTAEDEAVKNSGVGKSAKVVLAHAHLLKFELDFKKIKMIQKKFDKFPMIFTETSGGNGSLIDACYFVEPLTF